MIFKRKPHRHRARIWDGFYEHCRCGATAGDRRDPKTGLRLIFFKDWDNN